MSHGIGVSDKGYVYGESTWHGIESYKVIDKPVTDEQVYEVLDFPIEKRELVRVVDSMMESTGVFEAYRSDTGDVLIPSCTESYNIINNALLFDTVKRVFEDAAGAEVESVGTLFNGQTSFVNILLGKYRVRGDDSESANRLMYYNPLGKGSYRTCAHQTRIVCNNTLNAAEAQGKANDTLIKVRHTKNAETKLEAAINTIIDINKGFEIMKDHLTDLTGVQFNFDRDITQFVEKRWFYSEPSEKSVKRVVDSFEKVIEETRGEYSRDIQGSKYQLLQAYTNVIGNSGSKADEGYREWDNIVGIRAGRKQKVFNHLLGVN